MSKKKTHRLTDLDIAEVSLVGKPANRWKFLFLKSEDAEQVDITPEQLGRELGEAAVEVLVGDE